MNNTKFYFLNAITLLTLFFTPAIIAAPLWQANNAYLLHGDNYKVDSSEQTTLTLEHLSSWSAGDIFFFIDLNTYHASEQVNSFYGELSPRLSFTKLAKNKSNHGFITDILLATTFEFGRGDVESFLIGPGFDFNIPGFDYFSINIYQRFINQDRDDETIQITPVWGISHPVWGAKLTFEGYMDWNVNSDGNYHKNLHFNPRLKYDLSRLLQIGENKATLGLEYSYWKNKYGIKNSDFFKTNENALSLFLNYQL